MSDPYLNIYLNNIHLIIIVMIHFFCHNLYIVLSMHHYHVRYRVKKKLISCKTISPARTLSSLTNNTYGGLFKHTQLFQRTIWLAWVNA